MSKASAERIVIEGTSVEATLPEGASARMDVEAFVKRLAPGAMDTGDVILPDGTKAVISRGRITVLVHETPPKRHSFRWIAPDSPAPYGKGATYQTVSLAVPYVIVLAVFAQAEDGRLMLCHANEAFFSNSPLTSLDDGNGQLCFPGLLNCSRFEPPEGKPLSWICTQHLDPAAFLREPDTGKRIRLGVREVLGCLFETGFNYSSEHHEKSSWYSESARVIPEITPVERWAENSAKDECFALDLPWIPTGMSVRQVVQRVFGNLHAFRRAIRSSRDVAQIVLNQRPERQRPIAPFLF